MENEDDHDRSEEASSPGPAPEGDATPETGMTATPRDLPDWVELVLPDGTWIGKWVPRTEVVSEAALEEVARKIKVLAVLPATERAPARRPDRFLIETPDGESVHVRLLPGKQGE